MQQLDIFAVYECPRLAFITFSCNLRSHSKVKEFNK